MPEFLLRLLQPLAISAKSPGLDRLSRVSKWGKSPWPSRALGVSRRVGSTASNTVNSRLLDVGLSMIGVAGCSGMALSRELPYQAVEKVRIGAAAPKGAVETE